MTLEWTAFYAQRLVATGTATSEKPFVQHSIVHLCSGAASTSSCHMQLMEKKTCMTPHLALDGCYIHSHIFNLQCISMRSLNLVMGISDRIWFALGLLLYKVQCWLNTKPCFEAVCTWKQKLHCGSHRWKVNKNKHSGITHRSYLCIEATSAIYIDLLI